MMYLLFAVICSGLMAVTMRVGEDHGLSMKGITVVNYIVAVVISFALLEDKTIIVQFGNNELEIILGILNGILFLVTLMLYQWNLKVNGVPLAVSFARLGVLIPMILAMLIFGELPTQTQWIGVILAVTAILMINIDPKAFPGKAVYGWGLILLFVIGGMTDMMSKIFDIFANHALSNFYLFYTFLTALAVSVIFLLINNEKISKNEIGVGILVGIFNYGSSFLIVRSVINLPAFIAFPIYSVGTIIFVNLVNMFFLHETVSRRHYIGMGIVAAALIFLNI